MPDSETIALPTAMRAARLHGPKDLRLDSVDVPGSPGPGQALLRVLSTGICGSDLHSFQDARIGDTPIQAPLILGHEFSAVVEAVGPGSVDGHFEPLRPGTRVAVDPAQPCGRCELCEQGHPNLCVRLQFCGNYPYGGSFCQWMIMPAHGCFPVPDSISNAEAALLEPLGVAIHAVDLARIRVGDSLAIIGAGPIGLLILQVARAAGAHPVFMVDPLEWRLRAAQRYGAQPVRATGPEAIREVVRETGGRGVDIAIEAAWADQSVEHAAEMCRLGGRLVLVGIPSDDRLAMKHSTARRKGLTIRLSRRMKHVYPRAIHLVRHGMADLKSLVSHHFPLERIVDAFALNNAYRDEVVKVVVDS